VIDEERAILALAVPFGEASLNDGRVFEAKAFRLFVDGETWLPMRWSHGPLYDHHGVIGDCGMWRYFHILEGGGRIPSGLLALGSVFPGPHGDSLLIDVQRGEIGMASIAADVDSETGMAWPFELSLVHSGAYPSALILGHGIMAVNRWELLTRTGFSQARAQPSR